MAATASPIISSHLAVFFPFDRPQLNSTNSTPGAMA
jgi:hypothetical protein